MERIIYYGAYAFSIIQILAVLVLLKDAYGRDVFFGALLFIPPVFTLMALRAGPDREERALATKVRKAQLQAELERLLKK